MSFGCLCYTWLRPYSPHKLSSRSAPCIFVGYSPTQSAYYTYDPIRSKTYSSRHVIFIEHQFPFPTLTSSVENNPHPNHSNTWFTLSIPITSNNFHDPRTSSPCQANSQSSFPASNSHIFSSSTDNSTSTSTSTPSTTPPITSPPPTRITTRQNPKPNS